MARTIMEQKAFERARKVATFANVNQGTVIGALMLIWNESQDQGLEVVNRKWLYKVGLFLFPRKATQETLLKEFVTHRFLQKVGDDAYRIKGNAKHNSNLVAYKKSAKNARQVKAQKKENVRFLNENGFQLEENHANLCSVSVLSKQDHDCNSTTAEVIHSDDGKASPVAGTEKKSKQDQFEKRPDVRDSARPDVSADVSVQLQYLCANEYESDSSSLNFNKKEKEEKLIEASTDFVYDGKASAIDENFDEACYSFMEKFESTVDFEIRPGSMAKLRYSQLIKSGMTQNQILTMIDNYANYKLPQCKPGHYPIHKKFETFLGSPGNWICKEYLNPVMDKVKARQMAKEKAEDEKYHRGIAEGTAWREANRKAIESGNKNATAEDFLKPSDILNKMNLHLKF